MASFKKPLIWGLFFVLVGTAIGLVLSARLGVTTDGIALNDGGSADPGPGAASPGPESASLQRANRGFSDIARKLTPTVVSIRSTKKVKHIDRGGPPEEFRRFLPEDLFRHFRSPQMPEEYYEQGGLGSGFIVSRDGYILTNTHVVKGADEIKVTLTDKREFDAQVIGADSLTEVALVKIKGDHLPVAPLGDSDEMEIGEWVLAIGNPLQLTSTVTAGIVSSLGRSTGALIPRGFGIENFIQTDAVINPGNSGGPLVNLRSEVVGINTAIQTGTGYYMGYGFAIPVNMAKRVMEDFERFGKVVRAYLGIEMGDVGEEMAQALKLDRPMGVMIQSIFDDSPARTAGLREKDVITKIDDQTIEHSNQVQAIIFGKRPGDRVTLTLIRQGETRRQDVVLGELKGDQMRIASRTGKGPAPDAKGLGITVKELTKELAEQLGYEDDEGVVISDVERFSPAFKAGLREGDLIMEIDNKPVASLKEFGSVISALNEKRAYLFYIKQQDGQKRFVAVAMPKQGE